MAETTQNAGDPKRMNLGKIVPTPLPTKKDVHSILDIVAVDGRAYISMKSENKAAVTDTNYWLKLTENDYDMAVRLGLFSGTEQEWIASLSADSKAAAEEARAATAESKTATAEAKTATSAANAGASRANTSASKADASAENTDAVRNQALAALEILMQMVAEGNAEILNMRAIQELVVADAQLSPSRMEVEYPARITFGNTVTQKIDAKVFPSYLVQNVIFQQPINGGDAVAVNPDGSLEILKTGKSRIHIIAANNTSLYRTIEIEVTPAVMRVTPGRKIRLSGGKIRTT